MNDKRLVRKPLSLDEMSREELDRELQKGVDSIMNGRTHSMEEVDEYFRELMKKDE